MYCSKCGEELKDGVNFCQNCGTKVGETGKRFNLNISSDEIKEKAVSMKGNFVSGVKDLGQIRICLFANIAFLLLSIILAFTDTFKVDAMLGISKGVSLLGDNEDGLNILFVIAYIVSIVCILIPLLLKKTWKTLFFLPAKITTIITTIYFFLGLIISSYELKSSGYDSLAEFTITATGWIFIIVTLGAIVLTFKLSSDLKKQNSIADTENPEN